MFARGMKAAHWTAIILLHTAGLAVLAGGLLLRTPHERSVPPAPAELVKSYPPAGTAVPAAQPTMASPKRRETQDPSTSQDSPQLQPNSTSAIRENDRTHFAESYATLPLLFEANQGQTDERVKFLSRGSGYNLFLTQREVVLTLVSPESNAAIKPTSASSANPPKQERLSALALKFAGATGSAAVVGADLAQAKSNYFLGNDPAQWRRGVANYGRVEYHNLYSGIDAVFHGESQRLEFDFDVAPGADPRAIALEVHGAHKIRINHAGAIAIALRMDRGREIVLGKPKVYQEISGQRRAVAAKFVVRNRNRIGFSLGSYDHSRPLIIDPTLVYSTFIGPTQGSFSPGGISSPVNGVAVDAFGYAYVVGTTNSPFFPIYPVPVVQGTAPFQYYAFGANEPVCEGCDNLLYSNPQSVAFVAKFDPTTSGANSLIYSTYLGPIFFPPLDLALERAGGMQYLPPSWASGSAIAVDRNGYAYVTGTVFANAARLGYFPTTSGALQPLNAGTTDSFISVLDPTGEQLLHSTYLGGSNDANTNGGGIGDRITAIALDASDNVYVTGVTDSFRMSTQCAFQPFSGGPDTLFLAKLDPSLTQLQYYSYLFGSGSYTYTVGGGSDTAKAIAVNSAGEVYVVGGFYPFTPVSSTSGNIGGGSIPVNPFCGTPYPNPTPVNGGFQPMPGGAIGSSYGSESESGFVAKFNASGTRLLYLTYLGGNLGGQNPLGLGTEMDAVSLSPNGNAYVAGNTYETNLPTTAGVVGPNAGCTTLGSQTICSPNFLAEVNPAASGQSSLMFLTYLPQTLETGTATGVAVDQFGDILVAGGTSFNVQLHNVPNVPNPNGTTTSASTAQLGGGEEVATYLLELNPEATQILDSGYLGGDGKCSGSCYGVYDFPAGMALDTLGNVYLAGSLASNDFPTTIGAFQPTPLAKNSNPNGFLAKLSMGPSNQPQLTVTPPIGNFGDVPPGQSPQITLTVSNTGQAPLLIQNVTTTGPFTLLYNTINCNGSPSGTLVGSLSPGSSCTANVMFNSSLAGPFNGSLVFVDNSPQGTPDPNTPGYNDQSFVLTVIAHATHFSVSAPPTVITGLAFNLTLTALNASNNTATGYTGTVHFSSTDGQAVLPADYTFTAGDNGSHVFAITTLNTLGSQTITAADTAVGSITGTTNGITVNPPPATYFVLSAPSAATTGSSFGFTASAQTASNTTATSYTGTAHFTSTDAQASLPSDYTFTAGDQGTHVFSATLNTVGTQSITATDTVTSSITGISSLVVTPPLPPPPVQIIVNEPITVTDTPSFPDLFDSEQIKVTDTITLTVYNTSVGANVSVAPVDTTTGGSPITLTFSQVSQPGATSLTTTSSGPAAPSGFQLGNPGVYYNISTTASYSGSVTVCINYTGISFTRPPQLFHYQNGAWVNVTTLVSATTTVVCGTTTSFSPFALFQQTSVPTTTSISAPGATYGTPASVTVSVASSGGKVAGSLSLSVDGGGASTMTLSNGSATFSLSGLNAGGHSLSANFTAQGNFLASSATGTLNVAQAPLTIAATSAARPYGANNPLLTGTIIGLQNADPISANFTTIATPASSVGAYAITPVVIDLQNRLGNYSLARVNGTLTVAPEPTSLSVAISPSSIPIGQSTAITVTLTAPDMVIPIPPGVLAPVTVSSPIVSDILTNNGTCTPVPTAAPGIATCTITFTAVEPNGRTLKASFAGSNALVSSTGTADLVVTAPLESKVSCLKSDFRNVAVPGGNYLWFNSIFKVRDISKQKVTVTFFQSSVQFQYTDAGGNLVKVNQPMPDAKVVIDPSVTTASTMFDALNNVWITSIPFDLDDNVFLTGMPWPVPFGGIPADIEPVTWCGTFASDTAGVDTGWRWSAAAYSSFSTDTTGLGVKPMTDHDNPPANRDNAGTPENFKSFVIPGARGKGGRNYTGSYSGSAEIE